MSRGARIELDWADGTYSFRLAWGQLVELQEKCDAGPYVVLGRLQSHQWRIEDISNTIRLGLMGGGMPAGEALRLTRTYVENVDEHPILENVPFALAIIAAALIGVAEEKVGEPGAAGDGPQTSQTSPTESSASPISTEPG